MTEFELIEKIKTQVGRGSSRVLTGIGDDAAVLSPSNSKLLFCSDLMIESVHFDHKFITPRELGHKALAVCASDLVAMNGRALAATVSIALPQTLPAALPIFREQFLSEFYGGLGDLATSIGIDCVGGDLSRSPSSIFLDVACVGETENPKLRSGARRGDWVAVSGTPGASAAGLFLLQSSDRTSASGHAAVSVQAKEILHQKHLMPLPRFDLLPVLGIASALIDISDGLASELHHLAKQSGVGFEIESDKIPLHPEALKLGGFAQALTWALHGGEDYELLMTGPVEAACPDGFTVIGRVTEGPDLTITNSLGQRSTLEPRGFNHFGR